MSFTLLPAVDVSDGRSVRLVQGSAGSGTAHGDPLDAAMKWQADGAEWIHLVDLDAAFGRGSNADLLTTVTSQLDTKVELAGGICDDATIGWALATGCERVILATTALADRGWCASIIEAHGDRVAVGLDVQLVEADDGSVRHRLSARGAGGDQGELWETLAWLDAQGCARYVVTDVSRDGMLSGPNIELYQAVTAATNSPVIASGGIGTLGDLVALAEAAAAGSNVEGSIVGKALYEDRFTLPEALESVRQVSPASD